MSIYIVQQLRVNGDELPVYRKVEGWELINWLMHFELPQDGSVRYWIETRR